MREEARMAGRPLAGVVFTFSWKRAGQLFPLYAGRNYAGTPPMTRGLHCNGTDLRAMRPAR